MNLSENPLLDPSNSHPETQRPVSSEISFQTLLGGQLQQIDLSYEERRTREKMPNEYRRLGSLPFHFETVHHPEGVVEYILIGPSLNGEEINSLMYFAAPNRNKYGLDTDDITGDWTTLYEGRGVEQKRRDRHARIPGWDTFEDERKQLLEALLDWGKTTTGPRVVPLIRWKHFPDGQREWIFSNRDLPVSFSSKISADQPTSSILGLAYLQAYSSDITDQLPKEMGHNPYKNFRASGSGDDRTQKMGSTQVLALLSFSVHPKFPEYFPDVKTIFDSHLLGQIEAFLQTGDIPDITIEPFGSRPNVLTIRENTGPTDGEDWYQFFAPSGEEKPKFLPNNYPKNTPEKKKPPLSYEPLFKKKNLINLENPVNPVIYPLILDFLSADIDFKSLTTDLADPEVAPDSKKTYKEKIGDFFDKEITLYLLEKRLHVSEIIIKQFMLSPKWIELRNSFVAHPASFKSSTVLTQFDQWVKQQK